MTKTLQGLYLSFSGESGGASINNVYALDLDLVIKSKEVLDAKSAPGGKLLGLRGLAFGPDGDLYVAQGKDTGERALPPPLRFSGSVVPRPGALCSTRIPSCRLTLRRDLRIPTSRCSAAQATSMSAAGIRTWSWLSTDRTATPPGSRRASQNSC
jgi:hypothetical protein